VSGVLRFVAGIVLRTLLRTTTGRAEQAGRRTRPRQERAKATRRRPRAARPAERGGTVPDPPARSKALLGVMVASVVVGLPLMLIFEDTITRIVGVLCLFTFIISGVFAIADPRLIEHEEQVG
jgi:predicted lipid-binding transport protein (Tim44 family)